MAQVSTARSSGPESSQVTIPPAHSREELGRNGTVQSFCSWWGVGERIQLDPACGLPVEPGGDALSLLWGGAPSAELCLVWQLLARWKGQARSCQLCYSPTWAFSLFRASLGKEQGRGGGGLCPACPRAGSGRADVRKLCFPAEGSGLV